MRGDEKLRKHPVTALAYGAGLALIMDEFALLLYLKDVYWAKQAGSPSIWRSAAVRWPAPTSPRRR